MVIPLFDKESESGAMVHEKRMKNEEGLALSAWSPFSLAF
jgi:hypothetical protein